MNRMFTRPGANVADQLLHVPPATHALDAGSVKLAAPVWVCSSTVTVAEMSRPVVTAETVNEVCSTPDESMLMLVGDTVADAIVGRPIGQPAAGQNFTVAG